MASQRLNNLRKMKFNWRSLIPKSLWYGLAINQRASITLSIPLLCVILTLGTYFWMRQSVDDAQILISHTNEVLLESRNIFISLLKAETAVRGYSIGRTPEFLIPYNQTSITLPVDLSKLKNLVQDNPSQFGRSQIIEQLALQKITHLQKAISFINQNPSTESTKISLAKGKRIMDDFTVALDRFENEEIRLLNLRQANYIFVGNLTSLAIWCGAIISVLGTAVSVSLFKNLSKELSRRELNLQETRNLVQTIVANVVDGVVVVDERSQIESVNNSALKMFGYLTGDELKGQKWQTLIVEGSPVITNQLSQSRGIRQNGSWFPIEISISNIEFEDRQILVIRDITNRQKAAAQLQSRADELAKVNLDLTSTNQLLSERNQELDQFAYIASHDLKAPLRAIANLSEWLEADLDGQLPQENQTQLQLLRVRVHRMYALLDGVLEYARIGRAQIAVEVVSVEALLVEILDTLAPPSGFIVKFVLPLPTFTTSRLLLRQVLMNLMDNAIKYHPTPETGLLKIAVQELEEYYEFAVSDNGEGISPEFHQKVFTIFQTLQARDRCESTGVGLAIVKKIVETEGGKIGIKSDIGKGSTFYFTWRKSASA
jgi:PAS domain S-box-containing protein